MTLKELAQKLSKIFRFRYLTVSTTRVIKMWDAKPLFDKAWLGTDEYGSLGMLIYHKECALDLSEYADADGNIDYSKCIVEVG